MFYANASLIYIKDFNISAFAFPGGADPGANPPRPGRTVRDYMAPGSMRGLLLFCFSHEIQSNLNCVIVFGYLFMSALSSHCLSSFVAPTNPQTLHGST